MHKLENRMIALTLALRTYFSGDCRLLLVAAAVSLARFRVTCKRAVARVTSIAPCSMVNPIRTI